MKTPAELNSWAERVRKSSRAPDTIEFCEAVIEFLSSGKFKTDEERKRDRKEFMREYMRKYRKKNRSMGDFE